MGRVMRKDMTVQHGWSAMDARNGSTFNAQEVLKGSMLNLRT